MNWLQRSTAPGVCRSWRFEAGQDLSGYLNPDGNPQPAFDPVMGGLKFTIPAKGDANDAGWFEMNYTPGMKRAYGGGGPGEPATLPEDAYPVQFGLGDTYYIQWRQKFSKAFLENDYGTTWKQAILSQGDRGGFRGWSMSCTTCDLVLTNYVDGPHRTRPDQRGFPILYQSCVDYAPLEDRVGEYDFALQNQCPDCRYQERAAGYPGCSQYAPDEWMTFQVGISFGSKWVNAVEPRIGDGWVKLWMGREGEPQKLVHHKQNYAFRNIVPEQRHGKVWLLPYMTSRSIGVVVPEEAYTWYDEIIVSREFIADPALEPAPPLPEPTPLPPTQEPITVNLTFSQDVKAGTYAMALVQPAPVPTPDPVPVPTPDPVPVPTPTDEPATINNGVLTIEREADGALKERCFNLPLNTYVEIPDTAFLPKASALLLPPHMPAGFRDFGSTGLKSLFTAWSGMALWLNKLINHGGGHNDSSNNGNYQFDLLSMAWSILTKPTFITQSMMDECKAEWGKTPGGFGGFAQGMPVPEDSWTVDGVMTPGASHTYGTFIGCDDRLVLGRVLLNMYEVDPVTGVSTKVANLGIAPNSSGVFDPVERRVYFFSADIGWYTHYRTYDLATRTLSGPEPKTHWYINQGLHAHLFDRRIWCLQDHQNTADDKPFLWALNLETKLPEAKTPLVNHPLRLPHPTNAGEFIPHSYPTTSFSFGDAIYAMHRPGGSGTWGSWTRVSVATDSLGECSIYTPAGTPPPASPIGSTAPYTKVTRWDHNGMKFVIIFDRPDENLRMVRLA